MAVLAACAGGPPEDEIGPPAAASVPPTLQGKAPSGLVDMREVQIAHLGSAGGGKCTLSVRGRTYPFVIAGFGLGIGLREGRMPSRCADVVDSTMDP